MVYNPTNKHNSMLHGIRASHNKLWGFVQLSPGMLSFNGIKLLKICDVFPPKSHNFVLLVSSPLQPSQKPILGGRHVDCSVFLL
jgi:hypothetical protein